MKTTGKVTWRPRLRQSVPLHLEEPVLRLGGVVRGCRGEAEAPRTDRQQTSDQGRHLLATGVRARQSQIISSASHD